MIPDTITISEAADRYKVNQRTIRRAIVAGLIDAYRPGREIQVNEEQADRWFLGTQLKRRGRR